LWAEIADGQLTIDYALPISKTAVRPAKFTYPIESNYQASHAIPWVARLLDRAYGEAQQQKRAKVLVNPHAGPGKARKYWLRDIQPILAAARCPLDVQTTQYSGEAVEICQSLDIDKFDMVIACSGDGLPHEVINGLGKRSDAKRAMEKIAVVQMPCGSGNAMSCNMHGTASPSLAALAAVKGLATPLDLISITQTDGSRILSFLSQAVGIVAESDLATEHMRWMGQARFTVGFLQRLIKKTVYPCELDIKVAVDDKPSILDHYNHETSTATPGAARRMTRATPFDMDDSTTSSAASSRDAYAGDGLPPLRYGTVNDKVPADWHHEVLPTLGNFYTGNMSFMAADANFFPAALPSDGCMDMVTIDGTISRLKAVGLMNAVESGTFFENEDVTYRKVVAYRITPKQGEGYISIDGERVPFGAFQAEVHRGLGTTLARRVGRYEARGPGEQK
jgi:sphingosine kinase